MKKLMILVLALIMVVGSFTTAFASPVAFEDQLTELIDKGILKGDAQGNLNLDKGLTRAEGVTVYSRLFGLEEDIKKFATENKNYETNFTDVPKWAEDTIKYLYHTDVIQGVSETKFGSNNTMTDVQFTTMILRGLGFNDSEGEFVWDKSLDKAVKIGMISAETKSTLEKDKLFTREEMAKISYYTIIYINTPQEPKKLEKSLTVSNWDRDEMLERKKIIHENDIEKQKELHGKVQDYLQSLIDEYTIIVNGEPYELNLEDLGGVVQVGYEFGSLEATVDTERIYLKHRNGTVTYSEEYRVNLFIFCHIANSVYRTNPKFRYSAVDGHYPSDANGFTSTAYVEGVQTFRSKTVSFDSETLIWEIEIK